ncbi:hypothetical protein LZF95_21095 [Algoriphagus sp. AGSA1]|uniref:hypothetical protein n=1 Tax=Algoriphagus sp. AGSA1 TaxID=2907213 RepID=UPI001F2FA87F|nr:hypothetical protein [Algoriphagus sp. AGSA1]MCE7057191.1 hypothetical protein [Algoriphagus sp. AGSA1]
MFQRVIKVVLLVFLLSNSFSCDNNDEVVLEFVIKDENIVDEELIAKAFLNRNNWEIVNAYFDCESPKMINYSKDKEGINGCEKELFVKNDTIYIGFTPTKLGVNTFDGIEVLIKSKNSNLKIVSGSFNYNVVGS